MKLFNVKKICTSALSVLFTTSGLITEMKVKEIGVLKPIVPKRSLCFTYGQIFPLVTFGVAPRLFSLAAIGSFATLENWSFLSGIIYKLRHFAWFELRNSFCLSAETKQNPYDDGSVHWIFYVFSGSVQHFELAFQFHCLDWYFKLSFAFRWSWVYACHSKS